MKFQIDLKAWSDVRVQSLSHRERGIWLELLILMHGSPVRGKLIHLPSDQEASDALKLKLVDWVTMKQKIIEHELVVVCPETGALMNPEMVHKEAVSRKRRAAGRKGGNPILVKQNRKLLKQNRNLLNQNPDLLNQNRILINQNQNLLNQNDPSPAKKSPPSSPLPLNPTPLTPPQKKPRPKSKSKLTALEKKRLRVEANSKLEVRINSWFGRRPTTLWTIADHEAIVQLNPSEAEIRLLEVYYRHDPDDPDKDFRRTSRTTMLNNWTGEVDRAIRFDKRRKAPLYKERNRLVAELQERQLEIEEYRKLAGELANEGKNMSRRHQQSLQRAKDVITNLTSQLADIDEKLT